MSLSPEEKIRQRYPLADRMARDGTASPSTVRALALIRAGHTGIEGAKLMGVSRSTFYNYLGDPTGQRAKQRKAKGLRNCLDCGAPCNTDGSITEPSLRCAPCARAQAKAHAKWTPETIPAAMRRWAEETGKRPSVKDWRSGSHASSIRKGDWPASSTVVSVMGWSKALRAAGLPTRRIGGMPGRVPVPPKLLQETADLVAAHGVKEAAGKLGLTTEGVRRRLKQHAGQPTGENMGAMLTPEELIEREILKAQGRLDRLDAEKKEVEENVKRLRIAQEALAGSVNGSV